MVNTLFDDGHNVLIGQEYIIFLPSLLLFINLACFSTLSWCEIADAFISRRSAMSPTLSSCLSRANMMDIRVASPNTLNRSARSARSDCSSS